MSPATAALPQPCARTLPHAQDTEAPPPPAAHAGAADAVEEAFETPPADAVEAAGDTDTETCHLVLVANALERHGAGDAAAFCPRKPASLAAAGISRDFVEKLICRFLLLRGAGSGRTLARELGLPFRLLEPILTELKNDMMLLYRGAVAAGDFEYVLSDAGMERARRYMRSCSYAETAPVPLADYVASVAAQSLTLCAIGEDDLAAAFEDLMMDPDALDRLGPAVNAGRGMFLYGAPGNGKTSIAERVVRCYGSDIWLPRAVLVDDVIVRLFDPVLHVRVVDDDEPLLGEPLTDARWVRIRRPTVVVGGELTMEQLEMRHDPESNVSEAPLQMKSNCGVLLIDDFGRQTMPVAQLLNRWIVPLEKRYDFQKLPTGKKIQVPFDQLVVFSTNLAPRDLVDEAFLRRLPYKIEIVDPSPEQFERITLAVAPGLGLAPTRQEIQALIRKHFLEANRPMRCCHPRDLLLQIRSWCLYHRRPLQWCEEAVDFAVHNYFSVL